MDYDLKFASVKIFQNLTLTKLIITLFNGFSVFTEKFYFGFIIFINIYFYSWFSLLVFYKQANILVEVLPMKRRSSIRRLSAFIFFRARCCSSLFLSLSNALNLFILSLNVFLSDNPRSAIHISGHNS